MQRQSLGVASDGRVDGFAPIQVSAVLPGQLVLGAHRWFTYEPRKGCLGGESLLSSLLLVILHVHGGSNRSVAVCE